MATFNLEELADIAWLQLGMTNENVICTHLERQIARNYSYMDRRQRRGTHTPTDDAMANDCAVAALLIKILRKEVQL